MNLTHNLLVDVADIPMLDLALIEGMYIDTLIAGRSELTCKAP